MPPGVLSFLRVSRTLDYLPPNHCCSDECYIHSDHLCAGAPHAQTFYLSPLASGHSCCHCDVTWEESSWHFRMNKQSVEDLMHFEVINGRQEPMDKIIIPPQNGVPLVHTDSKTCHSVINQLHFITIGIFSLVANPSSCFLLPFLSHSSFILAFLRFYVLI